MISRSIEELFKVLSVQLIEMEPTRTFNRGKALKQGVSVVPANSLLFFTDVDMLFNYETIERIRLNTILGVQV